MKIIYNKWIPFPGYDCINLFGVVFSRRQSAPSASTLNHERIHTRQMLELLVVGFYLWYLAEWLIGLLFYHNWHKAYLNISFEREAYICQSQPSYLKTRKPYAWLRYVKVPRGRSQQHG